MESEKPGRSKELLDAIDRVKETLAFGLELDRLVKERSILAALISGCGSTTDAGLREILDQYDKILEENDQAREDVAGLRRFRSKIQAIVREFVPEDKQAEVMSELSFLDDPKISQRTQDLITEMKSRGN